MSLTALEQAYDRINKNDKSTRLEGNFDNNKKLIETSGSIGTNTTNSKEDNVKYSWYNYVTPDGKTNTINIGFDIPAFNLGFNSVSSSRN
jgi:hypothetical protein